MQKALARLPKQLQQARVRRIQRAQDLSVKRKFLPDHLQMSYDPYQSYLGGLLDEVQAEMRERAMLAKV